VGEMPRFWIAMQIVIVVCVLISAVIAIVRL
jgi:ABC-type multidrug transport system permease subunit